MCKPWEVMKSSSVSPLSLVLTVGAPQGHHVALWRYGRLSRFQFSCIPGYSGIVDNVNERADILANQGAALESKLDESPPIHH